MPHRLNNGEKEGPANDVVGSVRGEDCEKRRTKRDSRRHDGKKRDETTASYDTTTRKIQYVPSFFLLR